MFLYHNAWKIKIFILNQRRNLTLKQRWFWVDSKKQFYSYIMFLYKTKIFILTVKSLPYFERRNNISTLNQRRNLTFKQRWFWIDSKKVLFSCYDAQEVIIFILVLNRSAFECRNIIILSTLKQRQKFMLKQRWFWVDTKTNFALTSRPSRSNQRRQVNIDEFPRHLDVLCCCNFDGRMIEIILMYFFNINSTVGKSTQLQRAFREKKIHCLF